MTAPASGSSRRAFGRSWWGRAWIEALEQRARLDPNRLPRGRTYARRGRVGPLAIEAGAVRAAVRGSRPEPYDVHVRVRAFSDAEWDRVLDAVAAKAGHTAALLEGELVPEIQAIAAAAGVDLLPGAGEVGPRCSCPDWADPCKHAAAVVYLVADVLDADPFALLLLRGRTREEVLAGLRARRAAPSRGSTPRHRSDGGRPSDPGVPALAAFSAFASGTDAAAPPLPAVPLAPRRPGRPAPLAVDPPAASGLRSQDLSDLAADAARRAWTLFVGDGDGDLTLDVRLDLVRRAAGWGIAGAERFEEAARRAGMRPRELGRLVGAWRIGGADAVSVVLDEWAPDADALDEGRSVCSAVGAVRVRGNRITLARHDLQLRLGRSGSWYRFERANRGWELVGGPAADPAELTSLPGAPPRAALADSP